MTLIPALDGGVSTSDVRLPARRIVNQEGVNACFSCALAACLEARDASCPALAALFHFHYAIRLWPNAIQVGIGDERLALDVFGQVGICAAALHDYPFTPDDARRVPSGAAVSEAQTRVPRINDFGERPFRRLYTGPMTELHWKHALLRRQPVLAVIHTNASYWAMRNGATARWDDTDREAAGDLHAVAVLGASQADGAFVVQDSRGPQFGAGGQWLLAYDRASGTAIDSSFTLEYPE
jgi:hypothetical protein